MDYTELVDWAVKHYRGLKGSIHHHQQIIAEATGQVSLRGKLAEEGESVLLAYVAAQRAIRRTGPTSLQRQLTALEEQSDEAQTAFAKQLSRGLISMESTAGLSINDPDPRTPKRRRAIDLQPVDILPASRGTSYANISSTERSNPDQIPIVGTNEVFLGAPLRRAKDLFQDDFWDSVSIYWDPHHQTQMANVSMTTRTIGDEVYYKMEIGILPERVPMWAQVCLNVAVEDKNGRRYIRVPRVGKLLPQPACTIQGGQRDFSLMFKDRMLEAVQAHLIYQEEEGELRHRTEIIEMTIWSGVEQGAVLGISLGSWRALKLRNELFAK